MLVLSAALAKDLDIDPSEGSTRGFFVLPLTRKTLSRHGVRRDQSYVYFHWSPFILRHPLKSEAAKCGPFKAEIYRKNRRYDGSDLETPVQSVVMETTRRPETMLASVNWNSVYMDALEWMVTEPNGLMWDLAKFFTSKQNPSDYRYYLMTLYGEGCDEILAHITFKVLIPTPR